MDCLSVKNIDLCNDGNEMIRDSIRKSNPKTLWNSPERNQTNKFVFFLMITISTQKLFVKFFIYRFVIKDTVAISSHNPGPSEPGVWS